MSSRHISLNISEELNVRIQECAKADEAFNDTVRRLLSRAAKPTAKAVAQAEVASSKKPSSPHVKAKAKPTAWRQLKASAKKSR